MNPGNGSNMIRWNDGSGGYIGGIAGSALGMVLTSPQGTINFNAGSTTYANTQKMVFTNDGTQGLLGVNTTSPTQAVDVLGNIQAGDGTESIMVDGAQQQITSTTGTVSLGDDNLITDGFISINDANMTYPKVPIDPLRIIANPATNRSHIMVGSPHW